mgnify:FL=1
MFYEEPKGYPRPVLEGIRVANEYAAKKLVEYDENAPLYPDAFVYDTTEDNKTVSGTAYLNHLYEFNNTTAEKKLPTYLGGQAYTNNVMEKLLGKNAFSIIYEYPSSDR